MSEIKAKVDLTVSAYFMGAMCTNIQCIFSKSNHKTRKCIQRLWLKYMYLNFRRFLLHILIYFECKRICIG